MQAFKRFDRISGFLPITGCQIYCFTTSSTTFGKTPTQLKLKNIQASKRASLITKFITLAHGAVTFGKGDINPSTNKRLATVIEQAVKEGIPRAKIENSVRQDFKFEETVLLTNSCGMASLIRLRAVGMSHGRNTFTKKLKQSMFEGNVTDIKLLDQYFERKGVVVIDMPSADDKLLSDDESTELALEIDAEEVTPVEDGLKFLCSPGSLKSVVASLEERNFSVSYSNIDFVPLQYCQVNDEDLETYNSFIKLLEQKNSLAERKCDFNEIVNNIE